MAAACARVVTPLGVRFVDHALEAPVAHGLRVAAQPLDAVLPPTRAVRSASGVYGFHGLPGLHQVEHPDVAEGPAAGATRAFAVAVDDRLGRFLPLVFVVDLPLDAAARQDGLPLLAAHLFSAPGRPVASGLAAVRADLWDEAADAPAAHAVLRVTVEGRTALGVADAEGRVLAVFPYPALERLDGPPPPPQAAANGNLGGAAPVTPSTPPPPPPVEARRWPVTVQVLYAPGLEPPAPPVPLPPPWTRLPGIRAILQDQPPARVRAGSGGAQDALQGELAWGRELVLRTPPGTRLSILPGSPTH